jgi:hypothetical protein
LCRRSVLGGFFDDGTLFFLIFGENLHEVVWDGFVQLVADRSENNDTKKQIGASHFEILAELEQLSHALIPLALD